VVVHEGREDLRRIAAAGPNLDHSRLRRDAEEGQLLERLASFIPRDEFLASPWIGDGRVECQVAAGPNFPNYNPYDPTKYGQTSGFYAGRGAGARGR
jgi:hypothetical protein